MGGPPANNINCFVHVIRNRLKELRTIAKVLKCFSATHCIVSLSRRIYKLSTNHVNFVRGASLVVRQAVLQY